MSLEEAEAVLKRVSYKPGYHFEISAIGLRVDLMLVQLQRPDADGGDRKLDLVCRCPLPADQLESLDEAGLIMLVSQQAAWLELHEMDEWLRLDGKRLREPHP